jgi:uncharacterized membrane protein YgcG
MTPRRELTGALCALAAVLLAACGATAEGGNTTSVTPETVPTVPNVGALPAPLDPPESTAVDTTAEPVDTVAATTTTTPFGATGNRILMLGDSILASTSKRYSNTMCQALVPLGWQVRIEAEVSRPVHFGVDVMRAIGDDGWDAGLVFLGTNPSGDANEFMKQLNRIILAFEGAPVVLVTISEHRDSVRPINDVIEAMPDVYDQVSVLDWNAITDGRAELLWDDGIHPTEEGREVLAAAVAERVGSAPEGNEGRCLDSSYTDDSAGTIDGRPSGSSSGSGSSGSGSGSGSSGSGSGSTSRTTTTVAQGGTTTTTVRPNGTTTTVANTGPTTTAATGGTATTSPTPTTSPGSSGSTPTTSPPQTSPPQTSPPQTSPPATSPPATSPPTTSPGG